MMRINKQGLIGFLVLVSFTFNTAMAFVDDASEMERLYKAIAKLSPEKRRTPKIEKAISRVLEKMCLKLEKKQLVTQRISKGESEKHMEKIRPLCHCISHQVEVVRAIIDTASAMNESKKKLRKAQWLLRAHISAAQTDCMKQIYPSENKSKDGEEKGNRWGM